MKATIGIISKQQRTFWLPQFSAYWSGKLFYLCWFRVCVIFDFRNIKNIADLLLNYKEKQEFYSQRINK